MIVPTQNLLSETCLTNKQVIDEDSLAIYYSLFITSCFQDNSVFGSCGVLYVKQFTLCTNNEIRRKFLLYVFL